MAASMVDTTTGARLGKERSGQSAVDRSRQLQERSRSFTNPFALRALWSTLYAPARR